MDKLDFQLRAKALEEHFDVSADALSGLLKQDDGAMEKFDPELGQRVRAIISAERELVQYVRNRRG